MSMPHSKPSPPWSNDSAPCHHAGGKEAGNREQRGLEGRAFSFQFPVSTFEFRVSSFDFRFSSFHFRVSNFGFRVTTIAVAMSGGVDSSTAAALLVENNSDAKPSTGSARASVIGLTMQLW